MNNEIQVTFRKEQDGLWHSYSQYDTDLGHKVVCGFMDCICEAIDVLNKKGGNDE